ncbi:MAG: hypothetical protein RL685_307 [Pseudomonadota bacterium]
MLAFTFDFELFESALGSDAYATPAPWLPAFVVPGANVSVVGRDATGGVYVCCERGQQSCCLHIDTRGNAICIGEDVRQALSLIIALPYWPELLAQCPSGELSALRELAPRLEREACDDLPALPAAREDLRGFLALPPIADAIQRLHQLAIEQPPPVTVWSPHGWRYESPAQGSDDRVLTS